MSSSSHPDALRGVWQNAWDAAQPSLSRIRSEIASSTAPEPRITRVGKVDAELLDSELVQLLKEPLLRAFSMADVCRSPVYWLYHAYMPQSAFKAKFDPELTLLIHIVLYKFSIFDQGASYGAKLQGLRYQGMLSAMTGELLGTIGLEVAQTDLSKPLGYPTVPWRSTAL